MKQYHFQYYHKAEEQFRHKSNKIHIGSACENCLHGVRKTFYFMKIG